MKLEPIRPLKPLDDRDPSPGRDFAGAGSFSLHALERMLQDCAEQPSWRVRAKLVAAYYDGKQIDDVKRWALTEEDLEERAVNLIRPIINSVLGQEAKSRTDVRIETDDDSYQDVAEVVSYELKQAERETNAHKAVSDGYGSMVKKGLGWLHVCRNADPLLFKYRVEDVPVDEVWWDWRGQRGFSLDDKCRWLCRMRMIDLDELVAAFPQHREVLERSIGGWDGYLDNIGPTLGQPEQVMLSDAFDNERRFNLRYAKWDWCDTARKMVKCTEVWYRVPATVAMLHISPIRRVPYNPDDPRHVEAVSRGLVKVTKGITSQVRRALYAGPHRLLDEGTTRRNFPYIPFFAYRDDEDGSPYGLIDGMVAPQDDYNDKRHRIQWMLRARQIQVDNDALDEAYNTLEDLAEAVNRPDMVVVTNPQRTNANQPAVRVDKNLELQKEQFSEMLNDQQLIQHAAGRFASQLGSAQVQSGVANSLLIEQGEQAMGEMNDNYTSARRMVFEQLMQLIVEDLRAPDLQVAIGKGRTRRVVVLNTWVAPVDPATGQPAEGAPPQPTNMVADAEIRTGLAEVPNTPAYRQQAQVQLKEIITALQANPQATAVLAPAYIESTNLPDRQETADQLRKLSGLPVPGDKKGQEQAEQQALQDAQLAREAAQRMAGADVAKKEAEAEKATADARKSNAQAVLIEQQIRSGKALAEADLTNSQVDAADREAANEEALIDTAITDAQSAVA